MKPRLLLVEDDPTSRAFLAAALAALPAHVDSAQDCAQARSLARQAAFDLWLIDAHLPDGSGADLLADLRGHAPGVAALAHTAAREATVHDALRAAGFAEVLVKPLSATELQAAVRRLLGLPATAAGGNASPGDEAAATPVWDDAAALSALNGECAHVDALRKLFRDELPAVRAAIHAAAEGNDDAALRAALHRLDASCGFVGAPRLAAAVQDMRNDPDAQALARFDRAVDELRIAQQVPVS